MKPNNVTILPKTQIIQLGEIPVEVNLENLRQEILKDFLDSFEDDIEDATRELLEVKCKDCTHEDTPAIIEALRIWVKERMEKLLDGLAYDAYRSNRFKDILSEELEKYWSQFSEDEEF